MQSFDEQVDITLKGNSNIKEASIGEESLMVTHSENGLSPGVTFTNGYGGYFVQRFTFGNVSANIPNGEAGSFIADWNGITIAGTKTLRFSIGTPWRIGLVPGAPVLGGIKYGYQLPDNIILEISGSGAQITGDLTVSGDVFLTGGADCAEDFDITEDTDIGPGTVMVMSDSGKLEACREAYDKRAAGVISGAGGFKPALTLDKKSASGKRLPVALVGKVFCKVDASYGQITVGDLLTTSPTAGFAMKVQEPLKAFGAVIGKALRPHNEGIGMIPILVSLQ